MHLWPACAPHGAGACAIRNFILYYPDSFNPLISGDRHAFTVAVISGHPDPHHHFDCPVRPLTGSAVVNRGKVAFEISGEIPATLTRCTCYCCADRSSLYAYDDPGQFRLTTPEADIATYRWQFKIVAHNFCHNGGCGTSSDSPDLKPNASWGRQNPAR